MSDTANKLFDTLSKLPDEDLAKLLYICEGMALKNESVTINNKSKSEDE